MAFKITCIKKSDGQHENPHVAISELGWENDQDAQTGRSSRIEMYDFVNKGGIAYVKDSAGNKAYLIAKISYQGTKYVKTEADNTKTDNLLSLPECK